MSNKKTPAQRQAERLRKRRESTRRALENAARVVNKAEAKVAAGESFLKQHGPGINRKYKQASQKAKRVGAELDAKADAIAGMFDNALGGGVSKKEVDAVVKQAQDQAFLDELDRLPLPPGTSAQQPAVPTHKPGTRAQKPAAAAPSLPKKVKKPDTEQILKDAEKAEEKTSSQSPRELFEGAQDETQKLADEVTQQEHKALQQAGEELEEAKREAQRAGIDLSEHTPDRQEPTVTAPPQPGFWTKVKSFFAELPSNVASFFKNMFSSSQSTEEAQEGTARTNPQQARREAERQAREQLREREAAAREENRQTSREAIKQQSEINKAARVLKREMGKAQRAAQQYKQTRKELSQNQRKPSQGRRVLESQFKKPGIASQRATAPDSTPSSSQRGNTGHQR